MGAWYLKSNCIATSQSAKNALVLASNAERGSAAEFMLSA
jgi:hypothetical protein